MLDGMRGQPVSYSRKGQAIVETALLLPILMLLVMGSADLGRVFYYAIAVTNSARYTDPEVAQIGLTPRQASGMLGAAERRCNLYPPYEKSGYTEGDHWFRMPNEVAEIIKELAAE